MDLDSILVHWVDLSVKNLVLRGLERDHIEPYVENYVPSRILNNSLQVIVLSIDVVPDDVDYIPELFGALADELLIDPTTKMIRLIW